MSVLLETSLGDLVIDLDTNRSPILAKNFLKLCKCRYYTQTLIYNVQQLRFCQLGDPKGDGTGGCSIFGLIDAVDTADSSGSTISLNQYIERSNIRFIQQDYNDHNMELTKNERKMKGIVAVIPEMAGVSGIVGSQFLMTLGEGEDMSLDGLHSQALYLGRVVEDNNDVLRQINSLYCDKEGRPYTDVRIKRALIVHDPFEEDPPGLENVLKYRGIIPICNENIEISDDTANKNSYHYCLSPDYAKPPEERVEERIAVDDTDLLLENNNDDEEKVAEREEEMERRGAKSRAVVLEMLGDLPDADVAPAENVLFVCKLNPITTDDDLTLIFSRFDPNAVATVIRDPITQDSLCYAFVEFTSPQPCTEAYFKMNNVLVDDRRIKVDFSQSVSKEWNRYTQTLRRGGQRLQEKSLPANKKDIHHKKLHPNTTASSRLHAAPPNSHGALHSPSTNHDGIRERNKRLAERIYEDSLSGREKRAKKKHKKHTHDRVHKYVDDNDSKSTSSRSERPSRHYKKQSKRHSSSDDSSHDERHCRKERSSRNRHHEKDQRREDRRRKHSRSRQSKKKYVSY